jgi:hypothetical protein
LLDRKNELAAACEVGCNLPGKKEKIETEKKQ